MILIVDDDAATRAALADTLNLLGYEVLTASHGREALAIYEERHDQIDLVLSDLVMPEMCGLELYHALKSRYPNVKVILITGYPLGEQSRSLLEQGFVDWLQKPFSIEEIARKLSQALS